jgi:hypothetical protein
MRTSQFFFTTLKEAPADAEVISQKMMLRAGYIKRAAAGIYTWMPLGLRVLRKVENIVREEMNNAGALELLMPAVQPAELWQESGRWEQYGPELLRFKDRHQREFVIGPTHEEVITDVVRRDVKSYRQLPIHLYQVQAKFRDEIRPRFGVMRGREFLMKDGYSFHSSFDDLKREYGNMYDTYQALRAAGIESHAVLNDLVLIEDGVQNGEWPATAHHEIFGNDLEPIDGGFLTEDLIVVRHAQADACAECDASGESGVRHDSYLLGPPDESVSLEMSLSLARRPVRNSGSGWRVAFSVMDARTRARRDCICFTTLRHMPQTQK